MTNDTRDTTSGTATDDQSLRAGLREHTTELATTDPAESVDDLPDAMTRANIVALGEATHGTREFFRLKHRFLRHLVVEAGVRTFAMEANLPEARALDAYVVDGQGDPQEALEGVYFWTWQTESVLAMIEWLRAFNAGRPADDRVRFYGFDAQYTQGAVDAIRETLPDTVLATVSDDLDCVADEGTPPVQDDHLREQITAAERMVPGLREKLDSDAEWARRHLRVIEQAATYKEALADWSDAEDGSDDESVAMGRLLRVRDRAMAENIEWIHGRESGPTVLWGHDAHINCDRHEHRDVGVAAPSMGSHLAKEYGKDYCAAGFAFARGGFQAIGETDDGRGLARFTRDGPQSSSVAGALSELDRQCALVDVRRAAGDERTAEWVTTRRGRFAVGATYDGASENYLTEYALRDAFDVLCYVEETTRARPLD